MKLEGSWADLKTHGYVVARDFMDRETAEAVAASIVRDGFAASNTVAPALDRKIREHLSSCFPAIEAETGIRLTRATSVRVFPNDLPYLHVDDTPYYYFQDFTEYVNFWVPVVKPDRKVSGLSFIPLDVLRERAPQVAEMLQNRGCAQLIPTRVAEQGQKAIDAFFLEPTTKAEPNEPQTIVVERDGQRRAVFCDFDLRDLLVSPETDVGDAVILRGDLLHQTQDLLTKRLAISARALNGERALKRSFYAELSQPSRHRLAKMPAATNIFGAFELNGAESIPTSCLVDFIDRMAAGGSEETAMATKVRPRIRELLGIDAST